MLENAPGRPMIAPRPTNNRSRLSNQPRSFPVSARSALGRRIRDVADEYAAALGGWPKLTDLQAAAVRRASELHALAERTRADALRSGNVDPVGLARIEGVADRARRALGLPTGKPVTVPLREQIAEELAQ